MIQHKILHMGAINHAAGRRDFHTVIVNINMHLTAKDHIITMDQSIDKAFLYSARRIIRHFDPRFCCFFPLLFGIAAHKILTCLEKHEQAATDLTIIQRIDHT